MFSEFKSFSIEQIDKLEKRLAEVNVDKAEREMKLDVSFYSYYVSRYCRMIIKNVKINLKTKILKFRIFQHNIKD